MNKPVQSNWTGSRTGWTRRTFLCPFSCKSQILCTSCTFFAKPNWILHFLCYRCGPSLSDAKWREQSNATTSGTWIGVVVEIISKTCLFRENSVFSTSKKILLSAFATFFSIWLRDRLSRASRQVHRKLYGCTPSSLLAVAFFELEKAPKNTTFSAKIPNFDNIFVHKYFKKIILQADYIGSDVVWYALSRQL